MKINKVYIGGWFQRTTLHLSELFDFLSEGKSEVGIAKEQLDFALKNLEISEIERKNWLLEYISAKVAGGINLRIYEDGLMVLETSPKEDLEAEFVSLSDYYDHKLSPAISLIFSKGAPVPKELAQIKTLFPFVITAEKATDGEVQEFFKKSDQKVYSTTDSALVSVYKSPKIILIVSKLAAEQIRQLVEGQIFFREFKAQLHRYLTIHRLIWEEIAAIKERGQVEGNQVRALRSRLDDYQKTIKLIDSRISQMGSYLHTRAKIYTGEQMDKFLDQTFQLKFETLEDTLSYIKELWKMTDNYLNSAIQMFTEIQAESTKTSISSLQLITTLGVVAGIIGYLGRDKLPNFTQPGIIFFAALLIVTWAVNRAITEFFVRRKYKLKGDLKQFSQLLKK